MDMNNWSRRTFILSTASLPVLTACKTTPEISIDEAEQELARLESVSGGRIGVSALHVRTGRSFSRRGDERFAMCSSFKWLLGYFLAVKANAGEDDLDRVLPITKADLVTWSPVTETAVGGPGLSLRALCEATIQTSDNTAANLLLKELGGPEGFTQLVREMGDNVTRLDRWEPELNENKPGDPRDTSTPNAMTALLAKALFGEDSYWNYIVEVKEWMMGTTTGAGRLRAGMKQDMFVIGNKTGTSSNNQSNDIGFAFTFPTNYTGVKGPVVVTSYLNVENPMAAETDAIHARIGELAMKALI